MDTHRHRPLSQSVRSSPAVSRRSITHKAAIGTHAGKGWFRAGKSCPTSCHTVLRSPRTHRLKGHIRTHSALSNENRNAFLAGQAVRRRKKPTIVVSARREQGSCIVTATLLEDEQVAPAETDSWKQSILQRQLENDPDLVRGRLRNGLEYVILPNSTPEKRFEAHLEMHVGSVDEREDQQGIAHIVEHVTFLGSSRRDELLGTGARSNAYTDFHHTVFHVHSPLHNAARPNGWNPAYNCAQNPMLPQVLHTLADVAFKPLFTSARIEKERKAVLAEAQMMNTIEYRVDCSLLKHLHYENALGSRFPIGKTQQVEKWTRDDIVKFWQRWYFPANATLYLVGDFGVSMEECERQIESAFGMFRAPVEGQDLLPSDSVQQWLMNFDHRGKEQAQSANAPLKQRLSVRPPVEHVFGCGPLEPGWRPAKVDVFQHRLLQHFMLSIFCKLPVQPVKTDGDLHRVLLTRILLSVLAFRVNKRYVDGDQPFIGIDLDIADSSREGCAVSTLTITSEPKDWEGAVKVAVQEVRRLQKFGVTQSEMERYKMALLRDTEQAAEMSDKTPSLELLDYVMESINLDQVVMDQTQPYMLLTEWADTITVEDVNKVAASLLSFASHHGSEAEVLADAQQHPERYASPGPTRATSIVACYPAFTDPSGESIGGAAPLQRGASLTTDKHVDPNMAPTIIEEGNTEVPDSDVPEGAVRFELTAEEIENLLAEASTEVEAPEDVDVPANLLSEEQLEKLMAERNPHYVPFDGPKGEITFPPPDPATGITQRRLSNGMRLNYWKTDNEPRGAMLRIVAAGGRAIEGSEPGPSGCGSVAVGTRAMSEVGAVGPWRREQVELFCISKLLNVLLENDEECVFLDCHFVVGNGGLVSMLELLHNFLEMPRWDESAMERAQQMFISHYKGLPKSLERATADRILSAMFGKGRRFRDVGPEEVEALTLDGLKEVMAAQLHPGNIEINVVGDFEPEELEDLVLKYLGTIKSEPNPPHRGDAPVSIQFPAEEQRRQTWHLKDSDERAVAYIAGKAPPRWGNFSQTELPQPSDASSVIRPRILPATASQMEVAQARLSRMLHPVYSDVTLRLLIEILNARLFTTVRDSLGLTYDVSFELSLFDRLRVGWFVIHVTSTPAKIREALSASLDVLRSLQTQSLRPQELQRAQRTLLTRLESDYKDNAYRLNLITHLQRDEVPLKNIACIRDLAVMIEAAEAKDIYDAYSHFLLDEDHIFTCIGTSGPEPLPAATTIQQPSAFSENELGAVRKAVGDDEKAENIASAIIAAMNAASLSVSMSKFPDAMLSMEEKKRDNGDNGRAPGP